MASNFSRKIELKFWDVVIPFLSSSSRARDITAKTLNFYHSGQLKRKATIGLLVACAGFVSGFLLFTLSLLLS